MRKTIILLLLSLIFAGVAEGQEMSVINFTLEETDLTANQRATIVYDQNGEKCALIRVQTTQTGFTFDVGSLGVQKVEQKVGEIWVYVPFGVKKVTIRHQQLGTLAYNFPISIDRAKTYSLILQTGTVQTIVTPQQSADRMDNHRFTTIWSICLY